MIQAQRDKFGEHGFERVDKPGKGFHLSPATRGAALRSVSCGPLLQHI